MGVEIVTKEDLQQFRFQLLEDLKGFISQLQPVQQKKWLRSSEVRKLLKISPGTLQNLRITEKLNPKKIGGIMYYSYDEIHNLLSHTDNPNS